jgi:hypothetical protein
VLKASRLGITRFNERDCECMCDVTCVGLSRRVLFCVTSRPFEEIRFFELTRIKMSHAPCPPAGGFYFASFGTGALLRHKIHQSVSSKNTHFNMLSKNPVA